VSKMNGKSALGSRIAEVHNGSSLFTGDAGQGESNIRRWLIENDWLETICRCGGCVDTALGSPKLTTGGRYSIAFAVGVALAKYADHLPLARQVKQMARAGLTIDTQTLWDQLAALAHHLTPTHDALHAHMLTAPVLGADETRWPLLGTPGAAKWHAWALAAPDAICYRIAGSRGVGSELGALAAPTIGEEDEAARVDAFQQHVAHRRAAAPVGGRERDRLGQRRARPLGLGEPAAETRDRIGGDEVSRPSCGACDR